MVDQNDDDIFGGDGIDHASPFFPLKRRKREKKKMWRMHGLWLFKDPHPPPPY
uniref:Uncharacterized protein n=1 Tax=Leersia perrieri TaxID=77586 RepID=A0A0D9W1Q0_9ORYZ